MTGRTLGKSPRIEPAPITLEDIGNPHTVPAAVFLAEYFRAGSMQGDAKFTGK